MAKLRLQITDDPKLEPTGVHVVGRQRFGWVALLAAFAALICLPVFRNTMMDQAHIVLTGKPPVWLASITDQWNPARDQEHAARLRRVLEKHPEDVELHLGAIILGMVPHAANFDPNGGVQPFTEANDGIWIPHLQREGRLDYLSQLRKRFPGNPAVIAASGRYFCLQAISIQRKERFTDEIPLERRNHFSVRLLDPAAASAMLHVILEGEKADPQNAFFPTLAATIHVAAGNDDDAVAALRRAAQCTAWRDYSWSEAGGAERLLIIAYGDRGLFGHVVPQSMLLLPHYGQIRSAFQVLAKRPAGNPGAWQLRADMLQVGALLRDDGETLIGRLVGAALQELAFDTAKVRPNRHRTTEQTEEQKQQQARETASRVGKEAPSLSSIFSREADALARFRDKRRHITQVGEIWDRLMHPAIQRELLGLHLLGNLFGCLALWALSSVILLAAGKLHRLNARDLAGRLNRPTYVALIALSVGALLIPLGAAGISPANGPIGLCVALLWLMFVVRPLLKPQGPAPAWSPLLVGVTSVTAAAVTLGAIWPWEFANHTARGYWTTQLTFLNLFHGEWPSQAASNPVGFVVALGSAPLMVSVCVCALIACLRNRGSLSGWMEGVRGVARVLAATLAVGYLVFALVHAPASLRDGRIASQNFRNETALLDER